MNEAKIRSEIKKANSEGLSPCPFCGGEAEADLSHDKFEYGDGGPDTIMDYGVVVYCTKCDASMGMINVPTNSREEATRNWNRRHREYGGTVQAPNNYFETDEPRDNSLWKDPEY